MSWQPCLEVCTPELDLVIWGCVPLKVESPHRWRSTTSLGPFPWLCHSCGQEVLPDIQIKVALLQLGPVASWLFPCTSEKQLSLLTYKSGEEAKLGGSWKGWQYCICRFETYTLNKRITRYRGHPLRKCISSGSHIHLFSPLCILLQNKRSPRTTALRVLCASEKLGTAYCVGAQHDIAVMQSVIMRFRGV